MEYGPADQLAHRIVAHWDMAPTPERIRTWTDLLTELDEGRAGTAYARSRALEVMTPALFAKAYKGLKAAPPVYQATPLSGNELSYPMLLAKLIRRTTPEDVLLLEEQIAHDAAGRLPPKMSQQLRGALG